MAQSVSDFFAAIDPVANREFQISTKSDDAQFSKIFNVVSNSEPHFSVVEVAGQGVLTLKPENSAVANKTIALSKVKTFDNATYAGYSSISYEAAADIRDNRITGMIRSLGRSGKTTPETLAAQFLDRGFDTSYATGWDGKPLFSATHALPGSLTTDSNTLATPGALDEATLEEVRIALRNIKNPDGLREPQEIKQVIVPSAYANLAEKLNRTQQTLGSANNDVSVVAGTKFMVFDWLSSSTKWFVQTKHEDGLFWHWVQKMTFITDQVPMNLQKVYIAFFRARWGVKNWRSMYGIEAS